MTGMLQMELVMSQLDMIWSAYSKVLMSLVCTEECSSSSLIHIAHPSCPRNACFIVDWREIEKDIQGMSRMDDGEFDERAQFREVGGTWYKRIPSAR